MKPMIEIGGEERKREEGRGKREEGRGKREEGNGKRTSLKIRHGA
jgi:hypothetical protein